MTAKKSRTIKKQKDTPEKERYFGVILENIDSKFQILVEGHSSLENKFARLDAKIDGVNENLNAKIDDVHDKLDAKIENLRTDMESNFKTVFGCLSRIDDELGDIKREIADLKNKLNQKADLGRLLDLEKRVRHIETIMAKSK